ncbi:MAG: hypothetical protein WDA00_03875 [Eubacteriales bacterium]
MKKVLACLLALVCLVGMVSCKGKETTTTTDAVVEPGATLAYINYALSSVSPKKTVITVTYTTAEGSVLNATSTLQVNNQGISKYAYTYDRFSQVGEADGYIVTESDVKFSRAGDIANIVGTTVNWTAYTPDTRLTKINLSTLGALTVTQSGSQYQLSTTVPANKVEDVFGVDVDIEGSVTLSITATNTGITAVNASYLTAEGATVVVTTAYEYSNQSFDVKK